MLCRLCISTLVLAVEMPLSTECVFEVTSNRELSLLCKDLLLIGCVFGMDSVESVVQSSRVKLSGEHHYLRT